jgi:hypothetical protein
MEQRKQTAEHWRQLHSYLFTRERNHTASGLAGIGLG